MEKQVNRNSLGPLIGFLSGLLYSSGTLAWFDAQEIETGQAEAQTLVAVSHPDQQTDIYVFSNFEDGSRHYQKYAGDNGYKPGPTLTLADDVILVDGGRLGDDGALLCFTRSMAYVCEDSTRSALVTYTSVYNVPLPNSIPRRNLFRDVNDDGLDDLVIPNFDGHQIFVQQKNGQFAPATLIAASPVMDLSYNGHPWYQAKELYSFDMNLDGRDDLAVFIDGHFQVHYQTESGTYLSEVADIPVSVPFDFDGIDGMSVSFSSEDQSDGTLSLLYDVTDLNGDGFADMIAMTVASEGVFKKKTTFSVYSGVQSESGILTFETEPGSVISSGGVQFDVQIKDLIGDDQLAMAVSSVEIGVGKIIAALLTSSVKIDLGFYQMKEGGYDKRANVVREITATFSLSTGEFWMPSVAIFDGNGDGLLDLMVQDGDDTLQIYAGEASEELFVKKVVEIEATMPRDPEQLSLVELNHDGIQDMLIQIPPPVSDPEKPFKMVLLQSQQSTPQ